MASVADKMPELVLVAETDPAAARRARRLAGGGVLKRLYPSIYTSNVDSPPESIVLRHWQAIVGHLLPGGVISHRSAFDSRPFEGSLSITRGKNRRDVRLPGDSSDPADVYERAFGDAVSVAELSLGQVAVVGPSKCPNAR